MGILFVILFIILTMFGVLLVEVILFLLDKILNRPIKEKSTKIAETIAFRDKLYREYFQSNRFKDNE